MAVRQSADFSRLHEAHDNGDNHQNGHYSSNNTSPKPTIALPQSVDVELGLFDKDALRELNDVEVQRELSMRKQAAAKRPCAQALNILRGLTALAGVILFWVGLWNLYDVYIFPQALWAELLGVALGFLGLMLTSALDNASGIANAATTTGNPSRTSTEQEQVEQPPEFDRLLSVQDLNAIAHYYETHKFSMKERVFLVMRAVLALASAVLLWKALWNLFDIYIVASTAGREIVYCIFGLVMLVGTGTFIANSGVMMSSKAAVQLVTYSRNPMAYF